MREIVAAIRDATRVSAFCHENPDADSLGAALAIAIAAERLGKETEVVSADGVPPFLAFLPHADRVVTAPSLEPDLAVVVDAADLARIGSVATSHAGWFERARIANIDHHVSNTRFGLLRHVDTEAAATCEMMAMLIPELGIEIDRELATLLLAGIAQDTHTFAHPNATPRTLRVAADLVAAGAPLSAINRAIYADKPFATLQLWGFMLAGVGERRDGRIVHTAQTREMLERTGAVPSATEGFVDLLGITRAADINVLFKEQEPGRIRVSVRTSERADAVAITSEFGGGGHARAAGCTVDAPLEVATERVLAACERELVRADARGR